MVFRLLRSIHQNGITVNKRLVRKARSRILRQRWQHVGVESRPRSSAPVDPVRVFASLETIVINLNSRADRLKQFEEEIQKLHIPAWRRVEAVDGAEHFPYLDPFYSGSIGCSLSHVQALQEARWDEIEALLICEDDVEFLASLEEISQLIEEFLSNPHLDVLALYGKARGGSHQVSNNLRIVVGLVGTVCYVVKPHMAPVISDLFAQGVEDLQRGKRRGKSDILWNKLQKRGYFFAAPITSVARNRAGFSDIEGRHLGPR